MKYKSIFAVGLVAFSVALAIVVGQRLSAEAMAVVVGVVAGVAASIPTSLIVVWIATRPATGLHAAPVRETPVEQTSQSRVVVVHAQPSQQPALAYPYLSGYAQPLSGLRAPAYAAQELPPMSTPGTFTVIGGETLEGAEPVRWEARWQQ